MATGINRAIEIWNEQKFLVDQLVHALKTPSAFTDKAKEKLKSRLALHGMNFHASLLDKSDLNIDWPPPQPEST